MSGEPSTPSRHPPRRGGRARREAAERGLAQARGALARRAAARPRAGNRGARASPGAPCTLDGHGPARDARRGGERDVGAGQGVAHGHLGGRRARGPPPSRAPRGAGAARGRSGRRAPAVDRRAEVREAFEALRDERLFLAVRATPGDAVIDGDPRRRTWFEVRHTMGAWPRARALTRSSRRIPGPGRAHQAPARLRSRPWLGTSRPPHRIRAIAVTVPVPAVILCRPLSTCRDPPRLRPPRSPPRWPTRWPTGPRRTPT